MVVLIGPGDPAVRDKQESGGQNGSVVNLDAGSSYPG